MSYQVTRISGIMSQYSLLDRATRNVCDVGNGTSTTWKVDRL